MSVSLVDGHIDNDAPRMTDNEIIKAWKVIKENKRIPTDFFIDETLDLINRQKAEIEKLKAELKEDSRTMKQALVLLDELKQDIANDITTAKAEAIKEFTERLKETGARNSAGLIIFVESNIDKLIKEMVGE